MVAPDFSRPTPESQLLVGCFNRSGFWSPEYLARGGRMIACIIIGTYSGRGLPTCGPGNPAGVTPTTVNTWPLSRTSRPMTSGCPPNRACQKS